jgi:hypothetical protein
MRLAISPSAPGNAEEPSSHTRRDGNCEFDNQRLVRHGNALCMIALNRTPGTGRRPAAKYMQKVNEWLMVQRFLAGESYGAVSGRMSPNRKRGNRR